ncbi:MAG TPA: XdhC family protein, partial [Acidimicrobiia bacterium]|nr:XdhC family protein [Acidimicrobiia bacterium]
MGEDLKTHRILSALRAAMEEGQAVVMATVIDTRRSVPRRAGSKMLIYADGTTIGSIGGGEMEANVEDQARSALRDGRPRLLSYELVDP